MIKPLLFTYLGMVIAVIIMDFKHVKQAAAINRWLSYGLIAVSAGIWFYVTTLSKTFFVSTWITQLVQRWLPLP
ncbi:MULTISPECIES: hypothetical protein [Paenibacillus]|uniref:Uncharacterized protein n=1 Tax=Paenibacillus pabuli TaxID=1472 RepID=A0A855XSR0_9BACL|nr:MULTISPECIES: hypothetical protein [Paenibacillus]PWW37190.1 hypothetical protein DET56_10975 [Paenibacillus pabuli]PXW05333.1 hypothetical protein DEU73_10875 [Paenibacillus taichungensis]